MVIKRYYVKGEKNPHRGVLKCEKCGNTNDVVLGKQREEKIKNNGGKTLCQSCNNKREGEKRRGKPSLRLGRTYEHLQGPNSSQWKGGKYIDVQGYVLVLVDNRHHSITGWKRYKKEHVLVMENHLKRKLIKGEKIHHIDVNKQNNDIANLCLYINEQDHKNMHKSLEKIGIDLLKLGLVKFENGEYKMVFNPLKIIKE